MDSELEEMRANIDFEEQTICQKVGYKALLVKPFYLEGGGSDSMILLLASTFILIGAGERIYAVCETTENVLLHVTNDFHLNVNTFPDSSTKTSHTIRKVRGIRSRRTSPNHAEFALLCERAHKLLNVAEISQEL